jgi:hypothetical protein
VFARDTEPVLLPGSRGIHVARAPRTASLAIIEPQGPESLRDAAVRAGCGDVVMAGRGALDVVPVAQRQEVVLRQVVHHEVHVMPLLDGSRRPGRTAWPYGLPDLVPPLRLRPVLWVQVQVPEAVCADARGDNGDESTHTAERL